jgi:hypothetical protein
MNARFFAIAVAAIVFATAPAAQLPDISWTCPMHPDVLEAKEGGCSICGMDLVPVRLVLLYTCPVHAVIEQPKPGKCRICSRDLVQKTAALTFTCAGNRDVSQIEPGKCADGSAMVPRYTPRAHGDHNPKHGGIFFMAPDNWHHLEGIYPAAGRFRVYVYDDFSKPLSTAQVRKVRGRVVTKEAFDPKTGTTRELASTPLVLARNGAFLEARIESLTLPAKLTAKISFTSDDKESRFDFAFSAYSSPSTSARPEQTASTFALRASVDKPFAPAASVDRPNSLLDDLKAQSAEVESLLKTGTLGGIYVPALRAKDLALEIQAKEPAAHQAAMEPSVKQIVLAAYHLDNYGDLGDAEKAQEAFRSLSTAIAQLDSIVSERR